MYCWEVVSYVSLLELVVDVRVLMSLKIICQVTMGMFLAGVRIGTVCIRAGNFVIQNTKAQKHKEEIS